MNNQAKSQMIQMAGIFAGLLIIVSLFTHQSYMLKKLYEYGVCACALIFIFIGAARGQQLSPVFCVGAIILYNPVYILNIPSLYDILLKIAAAIFFFVMASTLGEDTSADIISEADAYKISNSPPDTGAEMPMATWNNTMIRLKIHGQSNVTPYTVMGIAENHESTDLYQVYLDAVKNITSEMNEEIRMHKMQLLNEAFRWMLKYHNIMKMARKLN